MKNILIALLCAGLIGCNSVCQETNTKFIKVSDNKLLFKQSVKVTDNTKIVITNNDAADWVVLFWHNDEYLGKKTMYELFGNENFYIQNGISFKNMILRPDYTKAVYKIFKDLNYFYIN